MPHRHLQLPDHTSRIAQLAERPALRSADDRSCACDAAKVCASAGGPTALVGHDVTFVDGAGHQLGGTVEEVALTPQGPRLTVAGTCGVDPALLIDVR